MSSDINELHKEKERERILSIDVFRGFTLTIMVFVNTTSVFKTTPIWLLHAEDIGLTMTDLVAPFFIFAITLTFKKSIEKYANEKRVDRIINILKRYLSLLAMGLLGSITIRDGYPTFSWGTLAYIGLAGIFTYLFIGRSWRTRLILVIIFSIVYHILLDFLIGDIIIHQVEGGIIGSLSWGIMMLLSTIIAESQERGKFVNFLREGIVILIIGLILHFIFDFYGLSGCSRQRVSISYDLISVGLASIAYYIVWYLFDYKEVRKSSRFFQEKGKNPIFLFVLHGIILGLLYMPFIDNEIPFYYVLLIAIAHVIFISWIAHLMDKNRVYIRL